MTRERRANIVTITGDIGSGKSVVGRRLAQRLDFEFFSTGSIQRSIAEARGMSTLELNAHSENHPEIDYEIDAYSKELGQSREGFVLDSRLAWHFIPHAFKVYLAVDAQTAAQRILGDSGRTGETYSDLDQAYRGIIERRNFEVNRFLALYGIDCEDRANYDLCIDTSAITPEMAMDAIARDFDQWREGAA